MSKKKHEKGAGSTPATVQLEQAGIPFKTYEYAHSNDHMDDGYGVEAATKLGFDEHQVFKTLMADTGSERVVGVVPVSGHMDLKALAAAVGAKKAAMADPKVAMRESGYVVGGISPLGQRTHHKTVLDESALQYGEILLSGGKRGFSSRTYRHLVITGNRSRSAGWFLTKLTGEHEMHVLLNGFDGGHIIETTLFQRFDNA